VCKLQSVSVLSELFLIVVLKAATSCDSTKTMMPHTDSKALVVFVAVNFAIGVGVGARSE